MASRSTGEVLTMATVEFADKLSEHSIPLRQILLDPNNPRLIGIDDYAGVVEERAAEADVQEHTLARLNSIRAFDQESLRASIEQSGLLPVDRVVVRPTGQNDADGNPLYIVVEGNRRMAACKTLLVQHLTGERTLSDRVKKSIEFPDVLVLDETQSEEARLEQWVIQGVRHISGLKPWGAYQSAKAIEAMLDRMGYSEKEVANALSISIDRVKRSKRVLSAIDQMAESEDFGSYAGPSMYTYFDEVLKRPKVRTWLGWKEDSSRFEEDDNLQSFYSWITPDDEMENGGRRIPVSESVRSLDAVIADDAALAVLNTAGQTVDDALRVAAPTVGPNWIEPLKRAIKALDSVPIGDLENLAADDRQIMLDLLDLTRKRIDQADTFTAQ
jgi:hypothetical protein